MLFWPSFCFVVACWHAKGSRCIFLVTLALFEPSVPSPLLIMAWLLASLFWSAVGMAVCFGDYSRSDFRVLAIGSRLLGCRYPLCCEPFIGKKLVLAVS